MPVRIGPLFEYQAEQEGDTRANHENEQDIDPPVPGSEESESDEAAVTGPDEVGDLIEAVKSIGLDMLKERGIQEALDVSSPDHDED
jgi:hypothetical protein